MTQATFPAATMWIACVSLALSGWTTPLAGEEPAWPFYSVNDITPPAIDGSDWIRNEVDQFILAKLKQHDLSPAPEANPRELIRRLYFDLIGLPPTPAEIHDFVEAGHKTYEQLVDQLLEDPRYGERWAIFWLDLAHLSP